MNSQNEQIRKHLERGDAKRKDLLSKLDMTDRQMRKLISEMPDIGSCHKRGYFLIKSEQDLKDSITDLRSKAKSIFKRADKQYTKFGLKFQPELIFKGAYNV